MNMLHFNNFGFLFLFNLIFAAFLTNTSALTVSSWQERALDAHNQYRSKHQSPPLQWSPKLEAYAQQWANRCKYQHSNYGFGESLGYGQSNIVELIDLFYEENKLYNYLFGGFNLKTGHFTQLVWKSTKSIGCGQAICNGGSFKLYVCLYDPPGNVIGQFRQNVFPQKVDQGTQSSKTATIKNSQKISIVKSCQSS